MSITKPFKALKHLFKTPHTVRYPYEEHRDIEGESLPKEIYRGFHSNDLKKCIGCRMCARVCPANAITYVEMDVPGAKGQKWRPVIDYGRCCYCGFCTEICPTKSLVQTQRYELISPTPNVYRFIPTKKISEKKSIKIEPEELLFNPEDYKSE